MKYPRCYIIRRKEDDEIVFFINVEKQEDDMALPDRLFTYLRRSYNTEVTTFAEAESYELFGVAPMGSAKEFCSWLVEELDRRINSIPHGCKGDGLSKMYPCYLLIAQNRDPVALVEIKTQSDDILPEPEWWDKFNENFERFEITQGEFNEHVLWRRAPELNTMELIKLVNDF